MHLLNPKTPLLCMWLVVLMAACASGPAEYQRGTFAPAPAPVRPGVGAPIYDPHVKPLPPQSQPKPMRVLPETPQTRREPGVWASSSGEPAWWTKRDPVLLDTVLPYPTIEAERDTWTTRLCAARADAVREQVMRPEEERAMAAKDKACLAARLYVFCATAMEANIASDLKRGEMKDPELQAHLSDVSTAAKRMKEAACSEPADEGITRWLERFAARWDRTQV